MNTPLISKNTKERIVATDDTIYKIVKEEIEKYGNKADLNHIDTNNVTKMSWMFYNSDFNGDLSKWDVSNVTDMLCMFCNSKFNGDISNWDVSNVTDIASMFHNSDFNGNISKWVPKLRKNNIEVHTLFGEISKHTFDDLEID